MRQASENPISALLGRLAAGALAAALLIAVPQAARAVTGPTLKGTFSYSNVDANVNSGNFVVLISSVVPRTNAGTDYFQVAQVTMSAAGAFTFYNLPDGQYYISAFRDVNGNGRWDDVEPWGQYPNFAPNNLGSGGPTPVAIQGGVVLAPSPSYDLTVADPGSVTPTHKVSGTITYAGASTGTLFVAYRVPNPDSNNDAMIVSYTTVAWTTGLGTYNYSLVVPESTQGSVQAWLDLQHRGLDSKGNPTVPNGNTTVALGSTFSVTSDVAGKSFTVWDPGAYNQTTAGVTGFGSSTITVTGTFTVPSGYNGKRVMVSLFNDPNFSSSQEMLYNATATVSGTSASFTIPNVSTAPAGANANTYFMLGYVDVDGSGLYNEGVNPIAFYGSPSPISVAQSSGTLPLANTTLVAPTNTGSISGTITIASNTLTTGRFVVKAEAVNQPNGQNDLAGPRLGGKTVVAFVPGQTTYNYTIANLGSSTNYYLTTFVDSYESQDFGAPTSTFSVQGQNLLPNAITSANGFLGTNQCNNGFCTLSNAVTVSTAGAATTGVNLMLQVPTTQKPAAVSGFGVTARASDSLTFGWTDVGDASGYRLVSESSFNVSGDLSGIASSYQDTGVAYTTNTVHQRYLISFNASGNSTSTLVNAFTSAVPASGTYVTAVTSNSLTVGWFANTNPAGATLYTVQLSTDNFSSINNSSTTANTFADFFGLGSNTSYYARVEALNGDLIATAFDVTAATATFASVPSTAPFSVATTTGITVNWTANGNAADTTYGLMISTGASPFSNKFTGNQTVTTTGLSYSFANLSTSTVYYVQLAALNRAFGDSGPATFPSTSTLASVPGMPVVTSNTAYDFQLTWTKEGNSPQAFYVVEISTDGFNTLALSSQTFNAGYDGVTPALHALQANTSYTLRVRAFNNPGVPTGFSGTNNSFTTIATPLSANPSAVGTFTLTENWLSNNNSPGTSYGVQIATDPVFGTITDSKTVTALTASFSGLSSNTAYYARVRGVQTGGLFFSPYASLPSTTTLLLPPGPGVSTFTAVTTGGAAYAWSSGGNPAGTTYIAQISTSASYATLTNSSVTFNTSASFAGLSPDTTYFFQVQSTAPTNSSAFVNQASTVTPAAVPLNLSSASTTTTSVTINWTANGNPSTTVYELWRDVTSAFSAPVKTGVSATTLGVTGLTPNTTYFFKVRALGADGAATDFDTDARGSTATVTTSPVAPSTAAVTTVGTSSMTANWAANGNPAGTVYGVKIATDPAFGTLTDSTATTATSYAFGGLGSNTTFYLQVLAKGFSGVNSAVVTLDTTTTLANTPTSAVAANPTTASLGLAWSANGNAAGTQYSAQISTDNFSTVNASSATLNLSATFSSLLSNSTYYLRVQAVNLQGVGTGFAATVTSSTLVAIPVTAAVTSVSSVAVTDNWSANNNGVTLYTVQIATDPVFGTLTDSSATYNTSATFLGLSPSTTYYSQVRARGNDGTNTAFAALPTTTTFIAAPFGVSPTFSNVTNTAATVAWGSNNGAGATYLVQIATTNTFGTLTASSQTASLTATFSGLSPDTTYFFQVQAQQTGQSSLFVSLGSTDTPAAAPLNLVSASTATTSVTMSWAANGNPATTVYELWRDVSAAFSAPVKTGLGATSLGVTGLTPNTTYYFKVRALGADGAASAFDTLAAGTTATVTTYPTVPSTAAVTTLGVSSMTANWGANGNAAGTHYVVRIATDPAFGTITDSTETTATSYAFTGLGSNTTYYFQLKALAFAGIPTTIVTLDTTTTLANVPASAVAQNPTVNAIGVAWSANGNAAGTTYKAQISTDNFSTVNASSSTFNLSAAFAGLQSNSTYYLRVQAVNYQGVGTAFASAAASSTLVAAPAAAAFTSVSSVTVTANWSANGNVLTYYTVQIATDPVFGTLTNSSVTLNTSAAFAGLSPSTTYYAQVRARGNDGTNTAYTSLGSTETFLSAPFGVSPTFSSVSTETATVAWGSSNGAGATYLVQVSTDSGFASVYSSSQTAALTATFGTGGQGPALTANVTYYFQVRAQQSGQTSLYVTLGSTVTPVNAPITSAIVSVASTTVGVTWAANGNPSYTTYEIWSDATNAFSAPVKKTATGTAYTVTGLTAGTSTFIKVRALPLSGTASAFDTVLSTVTLPPAPAAPPAPTGLAVGVSSISWTWTAATYASSYTVYSASAGVAIAGGSSLSYNEIALATNTAYGLYIQGNNGSGAGPLSAVTTAYTQAAPPANTASSLIYASSATISWSLNTNPAATLAEVQRSTDNVVFTQVYLSTPASPSYVDPSLIGCTTYYYRVRNVSGGGVATAFDSIINFTTLNTTPSAAIGLTAAPESGNLIALSWTASPTEGVTSYKLYTDSGTGVISATPLAVLVSSAVSYEAGPFVSSAAYTFRLNAVHRCGMEDPVGAFAISPASGTLANVRAAITAPLSGQRINGNAITLVAGLVSGTPDQVSQVTFQYRATGTTAWTTIPAGQLNAADSATHPNPATSAPYVLHWNVDGSLAAGSYDLRALAVNVAGSSDTVAAAITVQVVAAGFNPPNVDVSQSIAAGVTTSRVYVNTNVTNTLQAAGPNATDPQIKVSIPAGAVSASTAVIVNASNIIAITTAAPNGYPSVGAALSIDINGAASTSFANGSLVQLTFSYPSTQDPTNLEIWAFDGATHTWGKLSGITKDTTNHTISGYTTHFSIFQVFVGAGGASANTDNVRVYPNPFKPHGSANEGGNGFVAGDFTTGIIIDNLPAEAHVKIYTISGREVAHFDTSASNGKIQWDGRNSDGRDAATGGYFIVIQSPGSKSVVKKLLIVR